LEGDGRILGAGNGDPSYPGEDHPRDKDCKTFSIPAFNGLAQILIQSQLQPSTLTLSATSNQLKSANIIIKTK